MYKYQIVGNEIIDLLTSKKRSGEKIVVLTAKDVERTFNVSERCGAKFGTRYPLCCQAMDYATRKNKAKYVSGSHPGATYTMEYKLTFF